MWFHSDSAAKIYQFSDITKFLLIFLCCKFKTDSIYSDGIDLSRLLIEGKLQEHDTIVVDYKEDSFILKKKD